VALILGGALLALTPGLWRGTRTAVSLTVVGLVALAALNAGHGRFGDASVEAGMAFLLMLGRGAFRLGCSNRPAPVVAGAALVAWGLAAGAVLSAPAVRHTAGHVLTGVLHHPAGHALTAASGPRLSGDWDALIDALIAGAVVISVLALRSLVRPAPARDDHADHEYRAAREIVNAHGSDSLSPFVLRPDKALAFAAGGVLAYRVVGGTAVISADPVAPPGAAAEVLAAFQDRARRCGWQVALWGAAETHLADYRRLGLHSVCVGEEAFVDPRTFTLEGRAVRKLRQSVHRVERRGWEITARDGREIDAWLETEIDLLSARWRDDHPRVHGFAMGMGSFTAELRPDDLYVLARSPAGELGGVMRFVTCGENLSLDTMQRVGDTPNGLNEALVARALAVARERGVAEVSLNYAGLAHLVRGEPSRSRVTRALTRLALGPLHRRFQMDRLVRFNEKFSPQWRPRYLVYESRAGLPCAIVRVLQVEGYLPLPRRSRLREALRGGPPRAVPARLRPPGPIGQMR
jgi:lysyl-tRNA synthetase class 2